MLVWILLIFLFLLVLKYIGLILGRVFFLQKLKKKVKAHKGSIRYSRNILASAFVPDGKTDFLLSYQDKQYTISLLSTPFRRTRYHFNNNKLLELIVEGRGTFVVNKKAIYNPAALVDIRFCLLKYKINFDNSEPENEVEKYVILKPSPLAISKADNTGFTYLYNNDVLFDKTRICTSKYFLNNLI